MTVENISEEEMVLYYQIDYTETEVPDDCAYFPCTVPPHKPGSL